MTSNLPTLAESQGDICYNDEDYDKPYAPQPAGKSHTKSFSTHEHMIAWWRAFKDDINGCHEVGAAGEYTLKFQLN